MKNNAKHIFVILKERNGEYEYLHRSVHQLPKGKTMTAKRFVKDYLKGFYGGKAEAEDEGYYFFGGEVFVEVSSWVFIGEENFDILKQYL
ncbi:MAG: hypothetical protein Q8Q17_01440 [bacterium]|nr:hypothetical protein [bacterium]